MGEIVVSSEDGMELEAKETEQKKGAAAGENEVAAPPSAPAELDSSLVRWEKFLPKMAMRVLLVEADDSTRQIITALLRKCSYRVTAVSDGLKAWKVLQERSSKFDLILTEVELPAISGYALLTLITENDVCKNIPVIMMSTHDSVSTVYNCMLKGASDFLVKPVRKNELRNLWQHVWRRRPMSGDIGLPDESVEQRKTEATAENNAVSNPSSGSMACVKRNRESIEKGSDAQSTCTKPDLENEGEDDEHLQDLSQPKRTKSLPNDISIPIEQEYNQEAKNLMRVDNQGEDKDYGNQRENANGISGAYENRQVKVNSCSTIDLIGAFDNHLKGSFRSSFSNPSTSKIEFMPLLDLSLRRCHPSASVNQGNDDRQVLNHSDASAFSRYINKPFHSNQSPSLSSCNQQKDHKTLDKQVSYNTLDYNSDTHGPNMSPQNHVSLATSQAGQPYHQQTVLSQPSPIRGARIETPNNGFGPITPQVYCVQSGSSNQKSPHVVGTTFESSPSPSLPPPYYQLNSQPDGSDEAHEKESPTLEDRGRISSATDQSANSSFCNGKINAVNEEAFTVHEGSCCRNVQREAALTKFRLKRKDRCFEKKVRYESRKKLAEQRPRVKGQFVRQLPNDPQPGDSSAS